MTTLFLTSSVHAVAHDLVRHFQHGTKGLRLAFIDTAAEADGGDKSWLRDDRDALTGVGFDVFDFTFTGKTQKEIREELSKADVLYVSGGNSFYLMQQIQQTGAAKVLHELVLKQGKPYIGTSAGSVIAGPDTYPVYRLDKVEKAPKLKGYKGLGLVNFVIMPHWGSDHFKNLYLHQRLEHVYVEDQHPLIFLTDSQYVYVKDENFQIIEVK